MVQLALWITFFLLLLHASVSERSVFRFYKIACDSDPSLCASPVCEIRRKSRYVARGRFGCTPVVPSSNLTLRIANFKKTSANRYLPGLFDFTRDFCEISRNDTSSYQLMRLIVDKIYPNFLPVATKVLHPCPYKEKLMIDMEHNEKTTVPPAIFHPSGEYKMYLRLSNEFNQTFLAISLFYVLENDVF